MLESLLQIDEQLFELLNGKFHSSFTDWLFPWWRDKTTWIPAYIILLGFLIFRFRRKAFWISLALIATVAITDTLSHRIIKKQVQRPRPCHVLEAESEEIRLLVRCGSGYSFTSNHASNHFGIAAFLFFIFAGRWPWLLFLWAASIAYGQVYVGVHYPLDIFCGALLGILVGWLSASVLRKYIKISGSSFRV